MILLTTGATERAHEGNTASATARAVPSAFASAFFEGIESGNADRNSDGHITVREAFDYAVLKLRRTGRKQTPQMRAGVAGDIVLCRTPVNPGRLSRDVTALIRNGLASARLLAVEQLGRLLITGEPAQATTAELALVDLCSDDDERVALAANRTLDRIHSTIPRRPLPAAAKSTERESDPLWFRRAVFYEVRVRTFFDSNNDGVGDLRGLRDKLEYLQ